MREIRTSGSTRGRWVADSSVALRPTLPAESCFGINPTASLFAARRVRLPVWEKVWIVGRALAGAD